MPRYDAYAETQLIRGHTLTVYSNPRLGATVELDGRVRGRTPIIIRGVEKGPHTLRLTLEGFRPAVHTFELTGDRYLDLEMTSVPARRVPAVLYVLGGIVAGLIILALIGGAVFFLTRPSDSGGRIVVLATPAPSPSLPTATRPPATPTPLALATIGLQTIAPTPTPAPRPSLLAGVKLARALDSNNLPVQETDVFAPDDHIFVAVQTGNLPTGTPIVVIITAERVPGAPPNFEFARSEIPVNASGRLGVGLVGPVEGWPIGRYRVNVLVNGTLDTTLGFQVR